METFMARDARHERSTKFRKCGVLLLKATHTARSHEGKEVKVTRQITSRIP